MDLFFCDICDESIPASDLDRGMAFRRGDRVVCATCDGSMSLKGAPAVAVTGQEAKSSEPTPVAVAAASAPEGSPVVADKKKPAGARVLSFLWAFIKLGVAAAVIAGGSWLFMQGERAILELQDSVDQLASAGESRDRRFEDLQVNAANADQRQMDALSAQLSKVKGDANEGVVNLRTRFGRIENALESLRQEVVKDRQALGEEIRGLEAEGAELRAALEGLRDSAGALEGRVGALEELLQGGLSLGAQGVPEANAPSWASTLRGLKDSAAGNRWTAVTALGDTGDVRVLPYLVPMLKDGDVFVRMAAARVLGELGSLDAAGGLIEALGDAEPAVREAAVVSLRLLSGKDFQFDHLGSETERRKVQSAWQKWNQQRLGG